MFKDSAPITPSEYSSFDIESNDQSITPLEFTWYSAIKRSAYSKAYDDYRLKEFPICSRWLCTIALCVHAVATFVSVTWYDDIAMAVLMGAGLLRTFIMFFYTYIATQKVVSMPCNLNFNPRTMGDLVLMTRALCSGLMLILKCFHGKCPEDDYYTVVCNEVHEQNQLPPVPLMFLTAGAVFMPIYFRCHSSVAAYLSIVITFASVYVSLFLVQSRFTSFVSTGVFFVIILLGIHDFEYSTASSFKTHVNIRQVVREKVTAENEKRSMAENANELRHFIGNVAHDLKTPLQAFLSELDYLDGDDGVKSTGGKSSVSSLKSTCHFMTMTINRSLDFIKCTSGFKLQPKAETVSLPECFEWVRNCVKLYAKKNMRIIVDKLPADVYQHVITDKQWLLENLLCLASNSVKFVGEGGELRFRVRLEDVHSTSSVRSNTSEATYGLMFEVEDDGIGIPDDKMDSLFQPFKQAQRNAGGTGLGLYALANRTQAIGGTYGVRRRHDGKRGVVFWFTVPYRPDRTIDDLEDRTEIPVDWVVDDVSPATTGNKAALQPLNDLNRVKILLVEDSIMIQKATSRMLRNLGQGVDIANNGLECLQRIQEKSYDLILMDINMPVMDGLETIQRIRADEAAVAINPHVVRRKQFVIGLSADSDAETRAVALSSGMNDFVEKPLDMKRLKEKCAAHQFLL